MTRIQADQILINAGVRRGYDRYLTLQAATDNGEAVLHVTGTGNTFRVMCWEGGDYDVIQEDSR